MKKKKTGPSAYRQILFPKNRQVFKDCAKELLRKSFEYGQKANNQFTNTVLIALVVLLAVLMFGWLRVAQPGNYFCLEICINNGLKQGMGESSFENVGPRWYEVHTYSGYEKTRWKPTLKCRKQTTRSLILISRFRIETVIESVAQARKRNRNKIFPQATDV